MTKSEIVHDLRANSNLRRTVEQALSQDISKDLFRAILSRFARFAPEPYRDLLRGHRTLFFLFSSVGVLVYSVLSLGLAALIAAQMERVPLSYLIGYVVMILALGLLFWLNRRKEVVLDQAETLHLAAGRRWIDEKLEFDDYF